MKIEAAIPNKILRYSACQLVEGRHLFCVLEAHWYGDPFSAEDEVGTWFLGQEVLDVVRV